MSKSKEKLRAEIVKLLDGLSTLSLSEVLAAVRGYLDDIAGDRRSTLEAEAALAADYMDPTVPDETEVGADIIAAAQAAALPRAHVRVGLKGKLDGKLTEQDYQFLQTFMQQLLLAWRLHKDFVTREDRTCLHCKSALPKDAKPHECVYTLDPSDCRVGPLCLACAARLPKAWLVQK